LKKKHSGTTFYTDMRKAPPKQQRPKIRTLEIFAKQSMNAFWLVGGGDTERQNLSTEIWLLDSHQILRPFARPINDAGAGL
jgi:hypothetical protein